MTDRTCLLCKHFDVLEQGDYSEYTPGDGPTFECSHRKHKWSVDWCGGREKVRVHLALAETCEGYAVG